MRVFGYQSQRDQNRSRDEREGRGVVAGLARCRVQASQSPDAATGGGRCRPSPDQDAPIAGRRSSGPIGGDRGGRKDVRQPLPNHRFQRGCSVS